MSLAELRAYGLLCACAVGTIYAGSLASITIPKRVKKARHETKEAIEDDEEEEEIERISFADALVFPLIASVALLSLFLAFKYLSAELLQKLLGWYFLAITAAAYWRTLAKAAHYALGKRLPLSKYSLRLARAKEELFNLTFTELGVAAGLVGTLLAGAQYWTGHWLLVNLSALSLGFNAIGLLQLDSYKTASALLTGLFFYDIYWVFFTPVMISVAQNVDGPIKIMAPRTSEGSTGPMMLLGLGDIVLPGLFVAFAARFDYAQAVQKAPKSNPPLPADLKRMPYLRVSMFGYLLGLLSTFASLHVFKRAQPALLYLSPSCIASVAIFAWLRGEFGLLWRYKEGDLDDDDEPSEAAPVKQQEEIAQAEREGELLANSETEAGPRTRRRAKLTVEQSQ